jgi:kumamolisin
MARARTHVALARPERTLLPAAVPRGAADLREEVEVTLKLRRRRTLPEFVDRPARALSPAAFAERYGAAREDVRKVTATLARLGLRILSVDHRARSVHVTGEVGTLEKVFQVRLLHYEHESGTFRGRLGPLHLPRALSGLVDGVFGLDDRNVVRRRGSNTRRTRLRITSPWRRPWYFPAEMAEAYGFPQGDGAGQTITLLEFGGGYFPGNMAAFSKAAGLPLARIIPIGVNGARTNARDGQQIEVMLDVQIVASLCPAATIPVYFCHHAEKGWIDGRDAAIHSNDHPPTVVSISWGSAEDHAGWTLGAIKSVNELLKEAAMLGMTVCVASGDDDSRDQVNDGHAHVDFPAASPYVLAVGGTRLRKTRGRLVEVAWKDGNGRGSSSGAGVSLRFDRPPWQTAHIDSVNPRAIAGRCVPDVAANASTETGYYTVFNGRAQVWRAGPARRRPSGRPWWRG